MRIIVAVDQEPYSAQAVTEAARLARNTWPDVRLLASAPSNQPPRPAQSGPDAAGAHPMLRALDENRRRFLEVFQGEDCPYPLDERPYEMDETAKGVWEGCASGGRGRKDLRLRLRLGASAREILAEAHEMDSDLIIIGCDQEHGCSWRGDPSLPQKVAGQAPCSVLVVKGKKKIEKMVCCLDQEQVSQASQELTNQLVTLYQARLEVVGLTEKDNLKAPVEKKMAGILDYYTARSITPWLELVEQQSLPAFINKQARRGVVALWMGKKSIFRKIFSHGRVEQLIQASQSPVLVLR